ncbi:MAG TPA: hypothetical protein VFA60_01185 [Terriglobales bacterium]|nr:hypothetical protein [Terriglobales bacterium]
MPESLVYECAPPPFIAPPGTTPHTEQFGSLLLKESYIEGDTHPYRLRMEAQPSTKEEAQRIHHEALDLATNLDRVWAYVAGEPLFAKRLILRRADAPGKTDTQREGALSADVRSELRQSLHWLYDIANNRLEVRHVVSKGKSGSAGTLLPKLTAAERRDFLHDADLVIRGVVEREIGVPAAIVRTR